MELLNANSSDGTEMQTILPLDEFAAPAAAEGGDVQ